MFTDRFIKLPIKIYNKEHHKITGNYGDMALSWTKVNPMEIVEYREGTNRDEEQCEYVNVVFKNGSDFNCYLTLIEFEKLLNSHYP